MNNNLSLKYIFCVLFQLLLLLIVSIDGQEESAVSINQEDYYGVKAIDSDYLNLYIGPTSLPIPGHVGVFAKNPIKQGDVVCEYRGPVVKKTIAERLKLDNNYTWEMVDPDGDLAYILGDTICAYINDCINIVGNPLVRSNKFLDEWQKNLTEGNEKGDSPSGWVPDEVQCKRPHEVNLVSMSVGHKVLLVAKKDLDPGEELFYYYGNSYWLPRARSLHMYNHMNICDSCVKWERTPDSPLPV